MSLAAAMDEVPLAQAFALKAWHVETNPWCSAERDGDGYIAQHRQRLLQK